MAAHQPIQIDVLYPQGGSSNTTESTCCLPKAGMRADHAVDVATTHGKWYCNLHDVASLTIALRFYVNTQVNPPQSSWVHPAGPPGSPQPPSGFAPPPGPPPPDRQYNTSPYPPQGGYAPSPVPAQQWSGPPGGGYGSPSPQGGWQGGYQQEDRGTAPRRLCRFPC